jgi:pimeloyl-ACP methyl ester carboxylesterase
MRALVLANTRAEADSAEGRKQRDATIDSVRQRGIVALLDSMTPKLLAPATLTARPQVVAHVRSMIADTAVETAVTALIALRERADATDLLAGIDIPTLVIAGAQDVIIPAEAHRQFARQIPRVDFQVVEGAGHLTPLEQPEVFNRLLRGFVKSIE